MSKKYKILVITNIILFIGLANLKWNTDYFKRAENIDSDIRTTQSFFIRFENPPGIRIDTIIVDKDKFANYEEERNFILSSFNAKEECEKNKTIYKVLALKSRNNIDYKRTAFVGEYPNIIWNYCYSAETSLEINNKTQEEIDKLESEKKMLTFLSHFTTFFMILQIALIIYFVLKR